MEIDRKKKAIMVAIAYYLEKESAMKDSQIITQAWGDHARKRTMSENQNIQRRGRSLPFK